MGRESVIGQIKAAEAAVRARAETSAAKKSEIIDNAKRQAKQTGDDSAQAARREIELIMADARKGTDAKRQTLLQKGKADAEGLRKKADVAKAREFFMSKFDEYVSS